MLSSPSSCQGGLQGNQKHHSQEHQVTGQGDRRVTLGPASWNIREEIGIREIKLDEDCWIIFYLGKLLDSTGGGVQPESGQGPGLNRFSIHKQDGSFIPVQQINHVYLYYIYVFIFKFLCVSEEFFYCLKDGRVL